MQHTCVAFLHMDLNVDRFRLARDTIRAERKGDQPGQAQSADEGRGADALSPDAAGGAEPLTYAFLRMVKARTSE